MQLNFSKYLNEGMLSESDINILNEVLIQFGSKSETQFGQIVVLAGGAGSGKGFIKDKLLDIQGKVFDVDKLKELAVKAPMINKRVKSEYGVELDEMDMSKPDDVTKLHVIISKMGLDKGRKGVLAKSIIGAHKDRKPNIIFDVTLKDLQKMANISYYVQELGYEKKNIHIVWILQKFKVAQELNADRPRKVRADILLDTHRLVSYEMSLVLKDAVNMRTYMDGKFIVVPNQQDVDNKAVVTGKQVAKVIKTKTAGGFFFAKADYYIIKERGKSFTNLKSLSSELLRKIKQYVPNPEVWGGPN